MNQVSPSRLKPPHFIHVGFPKAASTWLRANLKAHPEIDFLFKTHFFHPISGGNYDKGLDYYLGLFSKLSLNQIIGESDEHLVAPDFNEEIGLSANDLTKFEEVIKRIKHSFEIPPKIIMIIRNQVDLLISTYSEYIYGGGLLLPINFYLTVLNKHTEYFDLRFYQYYSLLNTSFSSNNVLLLLQEDIEKDPVNILKIIYGFLGVDMDIIPTHANKKHRVGFTSWGLKYIRFTNLVMQTINCKRGSLESRIKNYINKILRQLITVIDNGLFKRLFGNLHKNKRKQMPEIVIKKINQIYAGNNFNLAQQINRNLNDLGYHTHKI